MKFSATFVPPEQFANKRWWRPARTGAAWFYHTGAPTRPPSYMKDYTTIDPQIRRLVMWLHSRGMPTLPSCSGHWHKKSWAERCFEALQADTASIRYEGLDMIDVENGVKVICRDPYWNLPWGTWENFYWEVKEQDGNGYLCFAVPRTSLIFQYIDQLKSLPGVHARVIMHANRLCLETRVRTADPVSQGNAWHSVEVFLRQVG